MNRVRVVADSIAPHDKRITTLVVPIWRSLLAELNTHRDLSRGSASSRAIPVAKMMERIANDPFFPSHWPRNQKGMQGGDELIGEPRAKAKDAWWRALNANLGFAQELHGLGVHKSIPNRLLEPWMTTEVVVTATEWENMLALRLELNADGTPMAEPHFYDRTKEILDALNASEPRSLREGEWHLPFLSDEEWCAIDWTRFEASVLPGIKRSAARCGRVSYLKHDGTTATVEEDFERHDSFRRDGHMGPLEHQATPAPQRHFRSGNLEGWIQYRKTLNGERREFPALQKKVWRG